MTIQEFAAANLAKLPDHCYALITCHEPGMRIVVIKAGETGYFPTDYDSMRYSVEEAKEIVDCLNLRVGVTPQQTEAMLSGSMFGWHVIGADLDHYSIH